MSPDLLETALAAAEAAADVHARHRDDASPRTAREKAPSDWVSETDLQAQRAALRVIRDRFPSHQVLAEEDEGPVQAIRQVAEADPSVPLWVVDPLDGTTNFLHGHPMHCASVGVVEAGWPVAGAVVSSATGERWWGSSGRGAFLDGRLVHVSSTESLSSALIATGFPFKALEHLPLYLAQMDRVLRSAAGIRRLGSAAMDLCYLACGRVDAFWELDLGPWDVAAGIAILEAAGGMITALSGEPLDLAAPRGFLAANGPGLHRELGDRVRAAKPFGAPDPP